MINYRAVAIVWLAASVPLAAQSGAIRLVLEKQQEAWNRGDLVAFMQGYQAGEGTTFVGATVTRGAAQVLARYRQRYPTRESMGKLTFSGIEIQPLGSGFASVLGRFNLERGPEGGGNAAGIFTLIFRRTPAGWKIILDHTS